MTNYNPVTEEVLEELRKAVGAEHVKMMSKLWSVTKPTKSRMLITTICRR